MNGVQIEGGGLQGLPTINKNWIGWQPGSEGTWISEGDSGSRWAGGASEAGYGFTGGPEANSFYESPFWRNTNNYSWTFDPTTGAPSVRVKSGDKTGTTVKYVLDGSGNYVPDYGQQSNNRWDTNEGAREIWKILSVPAIGLGAYGVASALGAAGAASGAGAAGGAGATGGTAAGTGSSLVAGGGTGAQTASTLQQVLNAAQYASKGMSLAGKLTGNEALSRIGGITGLVTGGVGGVSGLYNGLDSGNWMDALKGAYGTYKAGTGLTNAYNALTNDAPIGSPRRTGSPNMTTAPGTDPQASAPRNWLDQIFGIGAGVKSDIQNREAFVNLNDLFSRREQMRAPFEQKLLESYQNPDAFLKGDVYQAQRMLEQNKLDRGAAKVGRLANDVDRDVLMQAHALKALEGYRGGLRDSLSQQQLPYEIFRDAQTRNARAGAGTAGGVGYSGVGGSINDIIKGVTGAGGTLADVYKWLTGGGSPETASDPYGPPVLPGDGHAGGNWGVTEPGFNDWNMPETNINWEDWNIDGWFDDPAPFV